MKKILIALLAFTAVFSTGCEEILGGDWISIEGMRHVLVHGYYHIKPNQLWDTIDIDLPELKLSINPSFHPIGS